MCLHWCNARLVCIIHHVIMHQSNVQVAGNALMWTALMLLLETLAASTLSKETHN